MTERQREFVHHLAVFLAGDAARKSIDMQLGKPYANEWAALRNSTPLVGYPSVEEAEQQLIQFLGLGE